MHVFLNRMLIAAALLVALGAARVAAGPVGVPYNEGDPDGHVKGIAVTAKGTFQIMEPLSDPSGNIRCFVPDDPFFDRQWHLANDDGQPHVNVEPAWARGLTGSGVTIGVVDDSLETTHPDLAPNYAPADSFDFGQNDAVPDPVFADDGHGVSTSGLAAARGGNAEGVTGAAPEANLAGLRIDFPNQTSQMFVDATLFHSSGDNTNIDIKSHSYGVLIPFAPTTSQEAALAASAASGTIHTFAAGNERQFHGGFVLDVNGNGSFDPDIDPAIDGDTSKKSLQNSQYSLAATAVAADGEFAPYANWGASVFATTPSNGALGLGITTTDRTGADGFNDGSEAIGNPDYTAFFGGTSASAPVLAGVLALGKQANPALTPRMAKHLLVRTSQIIDPADATVTSDGGWKINAAGNTFNQNYGFGLVDADAFTLEALKWTGVTNLVTEQTGLVAVGAGVPDAGGGSIVRTFDLMTPGRLEEVEVFLDIDHTWRGDLEAVLTSPAGTTSRLMSRNLADSFNDIEWTFVTNAFWGEDPVGEWALAVEDFFLGDVGLWQSFAVTAKTGHLVPEPATLALMAAGAAAAVLRRRRDPR